LQGAINSKITNNGAMQHSLLCILFTAKLWTSQDSIFHSAN